MLQLLGFSDSHQVGSSHFVTYCCRTIARNTCCFVFCPHLCFVGFRKHQAMAFPRVVLPRCSCAARALSLPFDGGACCCSPVARREHVSLFVAVFWFWLQLWAARRSTVCPSGCEGRFVPVCAVHNQNTFCTKQNKASPFLSSSFCALPIPTCGLAGGLASNNFRSVGAT